LRLAIGMGTILALFIAWEIATSFVAYTDDAYVRSDVVAVTPEVTGQIIAVKILDNQEVHRGDLLAQIDPEPFQFAVNASQAALDGARSMPAAHPDTNAQADTIAQAQAALASAKWSLAQTNIRAPIDGTVNTLDLQVGDTATVASPLIGILAANAWRVVANYKQSYLHQLHPGGTAWVWLDAHPWRLYRARIRGIGRGISRQLPGDTGGLLPYVAPTTDWIRLQHRFPVTLDLVNPPAGLTYYMGADASCIIFP
jgi:multidrug efflux system membrane fusion protein